MTVVADLVLVAGTSIVLLAAIGALRFRTTLARMHAAAKAPTLGILLIGIGAALHLRTAAAVAATSLVVGLQFFTGPVGAQLLGRAVHARDPAPTGESESSD